MRFTLSLLALVASVAAQQSNANAFSLGSTGTLTGVKAGQPVDLKWTNLQGSTVTLVLRTGANSDLQTVGQPIASNIQNTGSYTYTPPSNIPEGADYAIEIVNDQDPSQVNYTPQFVISSPVKAVATSGGSTSLVTATTAGTATSASSAPVTSSAASSASSASGASTTGSSASSKASGSSTSGASTMATSTSSASASRTSGAAASNTPPSTGAAAPALKAGSGLFAVAAAVVMVL